MAEEVPVLNCQKRQVLGSTVLSLGVLLVAVVVPSLALGQDLNAALSSAESRAASAETEISEVQTKLGPAQERYSAIRREAAPARRAARAARRQVRQLRAASAEQQESAAARIARIEADHRQEVDDHDEQLEGGIGIGLVALVAAGIAIGWGWFRASAAVAWLIRLPRGQAIGLCVFGGLVLLVVGAVLSGGGGIFGALGVFVALLGPVLAVALLLARHSAEVQSGHAKALLGRERLPNGALYGIAAALFVIALAGLGGGIFAEDPKAEVIPSQLRDEAAGVQSATEKRALAVAVTEARHLGAVASRLTAKQSSAGEELSRLRGELRRAKSALARAQRSARRYSSRLAAAAAREAREAERRADEEAEEAEEFEEEEPGSGCDPNYTGCVPNTGYDVDCADVSGPVEVIGTDVNGLDADNDGIGCE